MKNKNNTFWAGIFVGFFFFLALYACSEPLNADSYQIGEVPWKPLYVKIVDD